MPDLSRPPATLDLPHQWLEQNEAAVRLAVSRVARRRKLRPDMRDELLSALWCHLVKNDYRVLRRYRGESRIATYLVTVGDRLALDMRAAELGKWRPSAQARRTGAHAVMFERMVARDGDCPHRAREATLKLTGIAVTDEFVEATAQRGRAGSRRFVELQDVEADATTDPWTALVQRRDDDRGVALARKLRRAIERLPDDDRALLLMRHEQGLRVSLIARTLGVGQQRLYTRFESIYTRLRRDLVGHGVHAADVTELSECSTAPLPRTLSLLLQ